MKSLLLGSASEKLDPESERVAAKQWQGTSKQEGVGGGERESGGGERDRGKENGGGGGGGEGREREREKREREREKREREREKATERTDTAVVWRQSVLGTATQA